MLASGMAVMDEQRSYIGPAPRDLLQLPVSGAEVARAVERGAVRGPTCEGVHPSRRINLEGDATQRAETIAYPSRLYGTPGQCAALGHQHPNSSYYWLASF